MQRRARLRPAAAVATTARSCGRDGFGHGGERGYGAGTKGRREGKWEEAHGGSSEGVSGLGEALVRPERRRRSRAAGDEDDEGGDDGGRPEVRGSTRRWRGSWRSSWTLRRGEGTAGSASVVSCGGGSASGAGRGRCPGEEGERERVEEDRGGAWRRSRASRATRRAPGRQGGRWRGAVARARAGHAPLPLSRTKTTEEEAGWAAGWLGRPAAAGLHRGGAPGKLLLFNSVFYFFLTFVLI